MPHVPHHVKCGRFHQALATAYSKIISNESCREASKTLVMMNPVSIESLKELASKV